MRTPRPMAIALLTMALMASAPIVSAAQDIQPDQPSAPHLPLQFAGVWDYNAEYSINILTGRPEQNPRGAPPRSIAVPGTAGRARGVEPPGASDRSAPFAPSPMAMREARDLARDLLEVPEMLTFAVSDAAVTVTDDLEREHVYPTDGRRQRYRLGASEFFARVQWDGDRLRRDIEGRFGFKMSEIYFLSPDASRLFVIVRVGDSGRGRRPVGFDRVYDRVTP